MQPDSERIKLSAREILLKLLDLSADTIEIAYHRHASIYQDVINYRKWRQIDKENYRKILWQLDKKGYIEKYKDEKKNILKLTPIGRKKALKYKLDDLKIKTPKKWDKKWRIVIFDIPEDKKSLRNIVRQKLKTLQFFQLQKSVWVHPYDCKKNIDSLKYIYSLKPYVQYIVAETVESEINLVDYFLDLKILKI